MVVLPPDNYRNNIRYYSGGEDISFYPFLFQRPALAMMAALTSEIINLKWDVALNGYTVYIHESSTKVALQVIPHYETLPRAATRRINGFLNLMDDVANGNPHVHELVEEYNEVIVNSPRDLMHFLNNLVRRAGLTLVPPELDDPARFQHKYVNRNQPWQDLAHSALHQSWMLAALPERLYIDEEQQLRDVYRIVHGVSYNFDRIEAMVLKEERDTNKYPDRDLPKPKRDLIFYSH